MPASTEASSKKSGKRRAVHWSPSCLADTSVTTGHEESYWRPHPRPLSRARSEEYEIQNYRKLQMDHQSQELVSRGPIWFRLQETVWSQPQ